MLSILDKRAQGAEDRMSSILDKHLTRLAMQPSEQKPQEERDADEAHVEAYCAKWRDEEEAELRARFDAFEQEPDLAKLAVQLAVQDVSEPALDCVEQKAGQHVMAGKSKRGVAANFRGGHSGRGDGQRGYNCSLCSDNSQRDDICSSARRGNG